MVIDKPRYAFRTEQIEDSVLVFFHAFFITTNFS